MEQISQDFFQQLTSWREEVRLRVPRVEPPFAQPTTTPDWVWNQYLAAIQGFLGGAYREIVDKLVLEADPREVWKPLERRLVSADERWMRSVTIATANVRFTGSRPSELTVIAGIVDRARTGSSGHFLFPQSRRKKAGQSIRKHAQLLAEELEAMIDERSWLPQQLVDGYSLYGAGDLSPTALIEVLKGLARAGEIWASTPPILKKPSQGNARRTIFIQMLTEEFLDTYGQALRGVTRSLTSLFFEDSEGLTEADISQIAPVAKSRRMASSPNVGR